MSSTDHTGPGDTRPGHTGPGDTRQGLGTPAGPEIGWASQPPVPAPPTPATTPFWSTCGGAAPPLPPTPQIPIQPPPPTGAGRTRPRVALLLATAVLAGGASGAGVVVALDRTVPTAGTSIVQQRSAPGSASAAGSTEAAAAQIIPSVVQVRAGRGSGSGVVMDGSGHVLTNHHVIDGASRVSLVLSDRKSVV